MLTMEYLDFMTFLRTVLPWFDYLWHIFKWKFIRVEPLHLKKHNFCNKLRIRYGYE